MLKALLKKKKSLNLFSILLISYFFIQYIFNIISFQYGVILEPLNIVGLTIFLGYCLFQSGKKLDHIPKRILKLLTFGLFFTLILGITAIFSQDPIYSFARVLITGWLFFAMLVVFYYIFKKTEKIGVWNNYFTKSLLLILVLALAGQLFIPEWRYGFRFSGGINPNGMGYIALFCNFWFMYQKITKKSSVKLINIGWLLSFILVIWSMSRTVIASFIIMYISHIFNMIIIEQYKITNKKIMFFLLFILILIPSFSFLVETVWFQENIQRLGEITNAFSRLSAWEVALEYFNQDVIFGGSGWWDLTNMLDSGIALTDSPHSSYLRL